MSDALPPLDWRRRQGSTTDSAMHDANLFPAGHLHLPVDTDHPETFIQPPTIGVRKHVVAPHHRHHRHHRRTRAPLGVTKSGLTSTNDSEVTTINSTDWSILQHDDVADVTTKAAAKVAAKFTTIVTYDDMYQEALVIVASDPETVQGYLDREEIGFLFHWLWCRLTTIARREATKKNREVSYETLWGRAA